MSNNPTGSTTAFTGARVIVGDGSTVIDNAAITVRDGIITSITRTPGGAAEQVQGGGSSPQTVISFEGKTIMPAIVNPHGHIGYMRGTVCDPRCYSRRNVIDHLRRFVYHGTSTFQSLGTDWNRIEVGVRDDQRSGVLDDPNLATLFTAGSGLVAAPEPGLASGAPFFAVDAVHQVADPADARAFVRSLAVQQVDVVKFWIDDRGGTATKLSPETCRAIVDEAHHHGLRAAAHIYTVDDAKIALRAGADILAHMPRSPEPDPELIEQLVDRDIAVFTSMSVQGPARTDWLDDPLLHETLPLAAIEDLRARLTARAPEPLFDTGETYRRLQQNFATLHQAGVRLVFSPDTGVFAQLPGIAEHRELEALVDAGLSPLSAVEFATRRSAQLLGLTDRGAIDVGRRADLLVLDADPRDDITNTRSIAAVIIEGRVVDRDQLRQQLQADSDD
ncbi:amidohydrolase family protein [Saccharopolyspora sp. K220]|uniref:amidohydrolase family protein n=1 Tax=Saccharopolyspora soli TaxID=2926618 RepID=UPI001F59C660|nr:amidohydrolase family protein [Saccharopolyspora soli]MCI2418575.1 amidohydrolase family protein [Saccharopolyspora soli]